MLKEKEKNLVKEWGKGFNMEFLLQKLVESNAAGMSG